MPDATWSNIARAWWNKIPMRTEKMSQEVPQAFCDLQTWELIRAYTDLSEKVGYAGAISFNPSCLPPILMGKAGKWYIGTYELDNHPATVFLQAQERYGRFTDDLTKMRVCEKWRSVHNKQTVLDTMKNLGNVSLDLIKGVVAVKKFEEEHRNWRSQGKLKAMETLQRNLQVQANDAHVVACWAEQQLREAH